MQRFTVASSQPKESFDSLFGSLDKKGRVVDTARHEHACHKLRKEKMCKTAIGRGGNIQKEKKIVAKRQLKSKRSIQQCGV